MKVIIDIPKEEYDIYQVLRGFMSYGDRLIKNGIPIPDNATNGDVIEVMFPTLSFNAILSKMYASCGQSLLDWWHTPYKRGDAADGNSDMDHSNL